MSSKQKGNDNNQGASDVPAGSDLKGAKRKGTLFDWVDAMMKVVIAGLGIWVSILGYSYQKSFTSSQLLVQQEKGDTEIRAQMFGKITDRLMRPNDGNDSLVQDALLAQVLALNFHELIDLKPLMVQLDSQLSKSIESSKKSGKNASKLEEEKDALSGLRSAARRIRDRQVAALITNPRPGSKYSVADKENKLKNGFVRYISVVREGSKKKNLCFVKQKEGKNGCLREVMELDGPRKDENLYISIDKADWDKQTFDVAFNPQKPVPDSEIVLPEGTKAEDVESCASASNDENGNSETADNDIAIQAGHKSFSVTWYDFPYTDNTLKANGDRYSVFIDQVCKSTGSNSGYPDAVRLGILYFPEDYYPSRDRPVSYRQLSDKLGWN